MSDHDQSRQRPELVGGFWKSRTGIALVGFLAIAGLLLAYEHRAHIFSGYGVLIVLFALCIGIHLFMHGSHGGHGGHRGGDRESNSGTRP